MDEISFLPSWEDEKEVDRVSEIELDSVKVRWKEKLAGEERNANRGRWDAPDLSEEESPFRRLNHVFVLPLMVGLFLGVHVSDGSGYGEHILFQVGRFDDLSSVGSTESIPVQRSEKG